MWSAKNLLPKRTNDLKGTSEFVNQVLVIRIRYGPKLASRSNANLLLGELINNLYRTAKGAIVGRSLCAVFVEADAELEDSGLIQAVMDLWNEVTDGGGRLVLVGYPSVTVRGQKTHCPPLLPDFGIANSLDAGLRWVGRPELEIEGGETWYHYPGVNRGRSFIPGEKTLQESNRDET